MKRKRKVQISHKVSDLRRRAFYAQGGLCYWCGRPLTLTGPPSPARATADHVDPRYAGGKDRPGNIVAACEPCNLKRTAADTNHSKADAPQMTRFGTEVHHSPFEALRGLFK